MNRIDLMRLRYTMAEYYTDIKNDDIKGHHGGAAL